MGDSQPIHLSVYKPVSGSPLTSSIVYISVGVSQKYLVVVNTPGVGQSIYIYTFIYLFLNTPVGGSPVTFSQGLHTSTSFT